MSLRWQLWGLAASSSVVVVVACSTGDSAVADFRMAPPEPAPARRLADAGATDQEAPDAALDPFSAAAAPAIYPDLETLHEGNQGIYQGCGPTNGVCHNANQHPNLASLGSVIDDINADCNIHDVPPKQIHNFCERVGDSLMLGSVASELGFIEPVDGTADTAMHWKLHVRDSLLGAPLTPASVVRGDTKTVFFDLAMLGITVAFDASDPSGKALILALPEAGDGGMNVAASIRQFVLQPAGSGAGDALQLGDPNEDGVFGASIGARLIKPGQPHLSYIFTRLTDPTAGPLMPRANCCYWTKASLRALWCWVAGLHEDGGNARDPIDYAACPNGPYEDIQYPEPGPMCLTGGMCPTSPRIEVTNDPTWKNIYSNVLLVNCGGSSCHLEGAPAGLDMRTEAAAYESVRARVVPGNPDASLLFRRLSPDLCMAPECKSMPLDRPPLGGDLRDLIRRWILAGATRGG